jgi:hypothetical protein
MPRAGHRLDMLVGPAEPDTLPSIDVLQALRDAGYVHAQADGPGPRATELVPGGFARARVETSERARLYANQLGGFGVSCPTTGTSIVAAFSAAWTAWREARGPRVVSCPACGAEHDLSSVAFRPQALVGRWVLVLADVGHASLTPAGAEALELLLGPTRTALRRPS